MKIRIISKSGVIPEYKTSGSAGFDLPAYLEESITLKPGERRLVPTGIFMELPPGYEAQVRARSGLAIKNGIGLVNGIGTLHPLQGAASSSGRSPAGRICRTIRSALRGRRSKCRSGRYLSYRRYPGCHCI